MTLLAAPDSGVGSAHAGGADTLAAVGPAAAEARVTMDEAAFRALYQRTAPALRGYLARVSGSRTLADDLLQESYLRLLRAGFVGESDEHAKGYLFRIATNLLRDHFRRPRRDTAALPDEAAAPESASGLELRQDFHGVFAALLPRERALLWLAYVEGSSHREIAAALDVKAPSIRVMLSRARARLAALLRERGLAPVGKEERR
jgi:RNA polymerase sigma-70 factor, ECF subfamily